MRDCLGPSFDNHLNQKAFTPPLGLRPSTDRQTDSTPLPFTQTITTLTTSNLYSAIHSPSFTHLIRLDSIRLHFRRLADIDDDAHRKLAMSLSRPSWPNIAMFRNARS